jgi:hypothetical protein
MQPIINSQNYLIDVHLINFNQLSHLFHGIQRQEVVILLLSKH